MGLQPLEFSECLTDSPYFRDKLHAHEKELAKTNKAIKGLISQCKDLLQAANNLSKAQRNLSKTLIEFRFECIGSEQTDDEIVIVNSLKEFGKLLWSIEDERDKTVQAAVGSVLEPLEKFRKEQIGEAKEGKRKFDKETTKFSQSLDRYLNMKQNKSNETQLLEADASLEMERKHFYQESMKYVLLLQAVQERKKFEFVEILLQFVLGWLTFYHQGYEVAKDFDPFRTDLSQKLQKCRDNFETTRDEAKSLMEKMLEKPQEHTSMCRRCAHEGYLFLMEKKALTTAWTKFYCLYQKENRTLTMVAYNQTLGKGNSGLITETLTLTSCTRRATDSIEKRFCFDVIVQDRSAPLTFQALSEEDRKLWLDAMDGKEPVYAEPVKKLDSLLDDIGFNFIKRCITAVEARGLEDEGLYRIVGVNSKVTKLTSMLLDRRKADRVDLDDKKSEWEMKTITSAIKNYFRSLPEPLMTFRLHQKFINAAKQESRTLRINDIHELVHQLPESNFEMLDVLVAHLCKVSEFSQKNLMSVSNIGVCFGPTLMRPEEETVAAIMDIKFCNLVIEILIENYDKIFKTAPEFADVTNTRVLNSSRTVTQNPLPLSSSQTNSSGLPSSAGPVRQSTFAQSYLAAAGASQSNNKPVMRSGVSRSVAGPSVYANVPVSAEPMGTTSGRGRSQPSDHQSSASSSCDSLNIKCSGSSVMSSSAYSGSTIDATAAVRPARCNQNYAASGIASSLTSSSMSSSVTQSQDPGRRVRTLYACEAENESELSFEPNQIITNVRQSREPGWLEGVLCGKKGLIPHNYVEFLN